MRSLLIITAAIALAACETAPNFASAETPVSTTMTATAAPATFSPPPDQQLLELERQLSATAQQHGLGAALAGVIDPNEGIAIRPGVTYTAADVERGLAPRPGAGPIYWQSDRVEVSSSGDMGVTSGRYVQVMNAAEAIQGRYVIVWRRDAGGAWKALTETRVPDPPHATVRRR